MIKTDTKKLLADSLKELLKKKQITDITIEDITKQCQCSRMTFYRHFQDKFDLMNWIFSDWFNQVIQRHPGKEGRQEVIIECMKFLYANQESYRSILNYHGQNSFSTYVMSSLIHYYVVVIMGKETLEELPKDVVFALKLYLAGVFYVGSEWVQEVTSENDIYLQAHYLEASIPQNLMPYFET